MIDVKDLQKDYVENEIDNFIIFMSSDEEDRRRWRLVLEEYMDEVYDNTGE